MSEYLKRVSDIRQDPEQRAAFASRGSQVVVAGPGSGKTYLLTTKAAQILLDSVVRFPHKVGCITFSRQLAAKMEKEFRLLGVHDSERMYVGTVHAFCIAEIVMPAARLLPPHQVPRPFRIASRREVMNSLSVALQKQRQSLPTIEKDKNSIKSNLDKYRRLHFLPEKNDFDGDKLPDSDGYARSSLANLDWRMLSHDYHDHLLSNNPPAIDFVYVEMLALRLVQGSLSLATTLSAKYPWWFVDEYQDLSPLFHRLVTHLVESGQISVFAIGDPDQCIYEELQGSKPYYLEELARTVERISGNRLVTLKTNYRSAQNIIDLSSAVLGKNTGYQSARQVQGDCHAVELIQYSSTEMVKRILRKAADPAFTHESRSVAILVPNRSQLKKLLKALEQNGCWDIKPDKDPEFNAELELVEWVQSLAQWCSGRVYLHEIVSFWSSLYQSAHGAYDAWHQIEIERRLFNALWEVRDGDRLLPAWLEQIKRDVLDEYILTAYEKMRPDDVAEFHQLCSTATTSVRLNQKSVRWFGVKDSSVFLTTFHSSKGLEFDSAIVVDLDNIVDSQNVPELKARLAYVAVSRAESNLYIVISSAGRGFATTLARQSDDKLKYWRCDQSGNLRQLNR